MSLTRYCRLEAEPDELAGAVDVDAILERVCTILRLVPEITLAPLRTEPVRIKVMSGSDLESVALAMGTTTGLPGGGCAVGLFLTPRTILVPRLDWGGLLAHEFTHLVAALTGHPYTEHDCARVGDQW